MKYFAAIDVSLEFSSVCMVDRSGKIISEREGGKRPAGNGLILGCCEGEAVRESIGNVPRGAH